MVLFSIKPSCLLFLLQGIVVAKPPGSTPTLVFKEETFFPLESGGNIKISQAGVPRIVDFNADGRKDLLLATNGQIWVYLKTPQNTYENGKLVLHTDGTPIDTGSRGRDGTGFACTDFTGDGKNDIIIAGAHYLYLLESTGILNGLPVFGGMQMFLTISPSADNRFDLVDWDRDGDLDVIIGTFNGDFQVYYYHSSNASFSGPSFVHQMIPGAYATYPRAVDMNGDGVADIFRSINWGNFRVYSYFRNEHPNELFVEYRLRHENFQEINVRSKYSERHAADVVDVDEDGVLDLVSCGYSGDVLLFRGVDVIDDTLLNIIQIMSEHESNLGAALDANDTLYNILYDNHRRLHEIAATPSFDDASRDRLYLWYTQLIGAYPQYLKRQQWSTGTLAKLAAYIWTILMEMFPDTDSHRSVVSALTAQTGYAKRFLEEKGVILSDNDMLAEDKKKALFDILNLKDEKQYSMGVAEWSSVTGRAMKYGPLRERRLAHGFDYTGTRSPFSPDCQVCLTTGRNPNIKWLHESLIYTLTYFELEDRMAESYQLRLSQRRYQIVMHMTEGHVVWNPVEMFHLGYNIAQTQEHFRNRGWWDGTSDWDTAFRYHFSSGPGRALERNIMKDDLTIYWAIVTPTELYNQHANLFHSDSKLLLDFAYERLMQGYPACMDTVFLVLEYYSQGGAKAPLYRVDEDGNTSKWDINLTRDENNNIYRVDVDSSHQLPGPSSYTCSLGANGFVYTCLIE